MAFEKISLQIIKIKSLYELKIQIEVVSYIQNRIKKKVTIKIVKGIIDSRISKQTIERGIDGPIKR
jgi:ribosomal protein L31E